MGTITKESIESKIKNVEYLVKDIDEGPRMTLCFITMRNGFISTGQSTCVNTADFVQELGEKYAYEQAFNKLWEVEGYLAKELAYNERVMLEKMERYIENLG